MSDFWKAGTPLGISLLDYRPEAGTLGGEDPPLEGETLSSLHLYILTIPLEVYTQRKIFAFSFSLGD